MVKQYPTVERYVSAGDFATFDGIGLIVYRRLRVRTNADNPRDAKSGLGSLGLKVLVFAVLSICSLIADRIYGNARRMIAADTVEERRKALG